MPYIVECLNPFQPFGDPKKNLVAAGTNLKQWVAEKFPKDFPLPTVCICNGDYLLRNEWDRDLKDGDVVGFVAQPEGPLAPYLWYALISIVIGVGIALLMPKPSMNKNEAESIYSIRGQQNKVRLGEAVEVAYGRVRLWPSYGALPYNRFEGNDQFQYVLLCLGEGEYDIDQIQIEDSPIENFQEVTYQIYEPNQPVTLFDDNVVTSSEVSDVELFGTNETEYVQWVGPFVVNEAGTTVNRIEVDFSMPLGLNHITDKGKVRSGSMSVTAQYRAIDSSGTPVGAWSTLVTRTWSMATMKPQRVSCSATVSPGRYEVRVSRTSEKDEDNNSSQMLLWGALRGFRESIRNYGAKTMLALKMKATNNLNDKSAFRINVWATRKIPVWDVSSGWSAPQATRSIVWAFCDIIRSQYGGNLSDAYLPLTELQEMDAQYEYEGRHFDFVFDNRVVVWEALRLVARHGRAVPMIEGSQIKLVRDEPKTLPECIFNQNNIVKDSFTWNISLPKEGDYDGVLVRYTDPDDFLPREIKCLLGDDGTAIEAPRGSSHPDDDVGDNLELLELLGCSNRDWAWREGMYHRRGVVYRRQSVKWKTGLEGHLPRFGALVGFSHDLPRWGSGGHVLEVGEDSRTLLLSEKAVFISGTYVISVRTKDGSNTSPIVCTHGEDDYHVVLSEDLPDVVLLSDQMEPPVYLFGKSTIGSEDSWSNCVVLSRMTPDSDDTVSLEGFVYTGSVFVDDGSFGPVLPVVTYPTLPDIPVLDCSSVTVGWMPGSNTEILISWNPADGAYRYELQKSVDSGNTWEEFGSTSENSIKVYANEGSFLLRIRPIGIGVGDWCTSEWDLTEVPDPWEEEPGTYDDLAPPEWGPSGPLSGGLEYQSRGGTCTLVGFNEFVSPSAPPKKFMSAAWSGSSFLTVNRVQGNTLSVSGADYYSGDGVRNYGAVAHQGSGMVASSPANPFSTAEIARIFGGSYGAMVGTASQTTDTVGYATDPEKGWVGTGIITESLTDEDTEDDAYQRMLAATPWPVYPVGHAQEGEEVWSSAPGVAKYENRTAAFTFVREQFRYRGAWSNVGVWWSMRITVQLLQRAYGSSGEWTESGSAVHVVSADVDGNATLATQEVEAPKGFEVKLGTISYQPL